MEFANHCREGELCEKNLYGITTFRSLFCVILPVTMTGVLLIITKRKDITMNWEKNVRKVIPYVAGEQPNKKNIIIVL